MGAIGRGTILENTYEIQEEIGSGGGGVVFRAKHLRLQTDVVVKQIKDEVRGKVRARQEADILKNLKHPYLPRVYDFIETADGVYTVMDFIHGVNLEKAVQEHGPYSQKQVWKWATQLGEALDYLHSRRPMIIHSDIKPSNIMLTEDGNVCLIDFNISLALGNTMESAVGISAGFSPPEQYRDPVTYARMTHNYTLQQSVNRMTGDGQIMRGIAYGNKMVGEQATEILDDDIERTELLTDVTKKSDLGGEKLPDYIKYIGRGIDERSDIYSLGVTLYYILVGKQPPADFGHRVLIEKTGISISEGFATVINKMMMLSPEERYQNGKEYLLSIRNCHKLDRRYKTMRRWENGMQFAALCLFGIGIGVVLLGLFRINRDKAADYYGKTEQIRDSIMRYDYETALNQSKELERENPEAIDAYELEVQTLFESGLYEQCAETGLSYINAGCFDVITEADRTMLGDICYLVGNAYYEMQEYENAKQLFETGLTYNTGNAMYYRDYAITLAKQGAVDKAKEQIAICEKMGMAGDSLYLVKGEIYSVEGSYAEAVECFEKAMQMTTDAAIRKRSLSLEVDCLKKMGDDMIDYEITLLEKYEKQEDSSSAYVIKNYLADAYMRKAHTDDSIKEEYYKKALTIFCAIYESGYVTYQLQENIAILYENIMEFDKAEDFLLQMASDYPNRYEPYKRLAYLEADRQQNKENGKRDYQKMKEYYEAAVERYTEDVQDQEMHMLDQMMQELADGGWF